MVGLDWSLRYWICEELLMESERYSWSCGTYRSGFTYLDAESAYEGGKQFKEARISTKDEDVRIWCRKIEEVIF